MKTLSKILLFLFIGLAIFYSCEDETFTEEDAIDAKLVSEAANEKVEEKKTKENEGKFYDMESFLQDQKTRRLSVLYGASTLLGACRRSIHHSLYQSDCQCTWP